MPGIYKSYNYNKKISKIVNIGQDRTHCQDSKIVKMLYRSDYELPKETRMPANIIGKHPKLRREEC